MASRVIMQTFQTPIMSSLFLHTFPDTINTLQMTSLGEPGPYPQADITSSAVYVYLNLEPFPFPSKSANLTGI